MQKYLGDLIHFSFRSTTKRTFSCTLHTPTSLCTARSRKAFYLSSSTFGQTWPLWGKEVQGKTEPKICPKREWWFHRSTFFLFLAILYWRVAEFWRLEQKTMKSVIAETYSSLTPKKAKKPENVIKYYCIIEYTHMSLNLKGNLCERLVLEWTKKPSRLLFWVWTRILHSSSFVKYCANVFVQLINDAENPKWSLFILIIVQKRKCHQRWRKHRQNTFCVVKEKNGTILRYDGS